MIGRGESFKIDFEKAYGRVDWDFLDWVEVLDERMLVFKKYCDLSYCQCLRMD